MKITKNTKNFKVKDLHFLRSMREVKEKINKSKEI